MSSRRTGSSLLLVAAVLALASGSARAGSSQLVSPNGSVGPLRVDRSTRSQVIAYAGKPDVERRSRGDDFAYDVLGYGCARRVGVLRDYPIECRTAFYLVRGKLGFFFTHDRRYLDSAGVQIGTSTARAERLLHQKVYSGCGNYIRLAARGVRLTVEFSDGKTRKTSRGMLLVGGHVTGFYLHSRRHDPGVTDCA